MVFYVIRCATGEGWQDIMTECLPKKLCEPLSGKSGDDCGSHVAVPFFTSFVFLSSFLVPSLAISSHKVSS